MVKKALVVGLNYPNQKHQLYGCVNDCLNWVAVLEKQFQIEDVRVLIDQNPDGSLTTYPTQIPTKHNILAQLGWLCSGVEQGDTLAFIFCGHGTQVRTGSQYADEALVPEDYSHTDEQGNPTLVFDDELHALFKRLPSGSFLTAIFDCCHATHMLDVPSFVESGKVHQSRTRPLEVTKRLEHAWRKNPHAYARPRFIAPISWKGQRHKRTEDGSGQHFGCMNLDPGVTALCFAACSTHETALDANIKAQQQGMMSFCLQEALTALHNTCTYERLLEKASEVADDIRAKYMPTMDQNFHLSFCPHGPPSEVVFLDERYATVSQHRLSQHKEKENQQRRQQCPPRQPAGRPQEYDKHLSQAPRQTSADFIPTPRYDGPPQVPSLRKEPASPENRRPREPASPLGLQAPSSPMPYVDPLAAIGMGPVSLGFSPMISQPSAMGNYAQAPALPSIVGMGAGGSPQPEKNIFGMPNLFNRSAADASAPSGAAAIVATSAPVAPSNLFSNFFGGAGNLFDGAGGLQAPSQQSAAFSSQQYATPSSWQQAFGSQQTAFGSQQTTFGLQQPASGLPYQPSSAGFFFSAQPGGSQQGACSSQQGTFSGQQGAFGSQQGVFGSQQGAFGSPQGAFSSQLPAGGVQAGPARTPSGHGSALGGTLGMTSGVPARSSPTPHVNAYATNTAFSNGLTPSATGF